MNELYKTNKFLKDLEKHNIKMITQGDCGYPEKLNFIEDKPEVLFYKGKLPDEDKPVVAIVGARACSNYGRAIAKEIGRELSDNGVQVISGMARGIDTYSQLGALDGRGQTFSVLGCGVDICYPTENIELYNEIIKNGGVISEYPPGSKPIAWHFPRRNRLISGLADLIVVVEAKEKSGSLITVEWALEQGKDVMAVPGRIGEQLSSGCNRLIKSGAGIITSVKEILEELKYKTSDKDCKMLSEEKILEKDFLMLYSELSLQPKSIYELIESTGLEYGTLADMLLQLQLKGFVEQPANNYYTRLI